MHLHPNGQAPMIPTNHTLQDDFTCKGKFWLPPTKRRKPRKVDGVLRVNAGDDIGLELFGDFATPAAEAGLLRYGGNPPLIHGRTDDGRAVTLFDSLWTSRDSNSAGA